MARPFRTPIVLPDGTEVASVADLRPDIGWTTLTGDTVSALATLEQWGTETINLGNPGRAVSVHASVSGITVNSSGSVVRSRVRVEISLNGGGTFAAGDLLRSKTDGAGVSEIPVLSVCTTSGTPTGDVVVRAMIFQDDGTAGDIIWNIGRIVAVMY